MDVELKSQSGQSKSDIGLPNFTRRQPGWRCLWCGAEGVHGPLMICAECRAWYEHNRRGVPEDMSS